MSVPKKSIKKPVMTPNAPVTPQTINPKPVTINPKPVAVPAKPTVAAKKPVAPKAPVVKTPLAKRPVVKRPVTPKVPVAAKRPVAPVAPKAPVAGGPTPKVLLGPTVKHVWTRKDTYAELAFKYYGSMEEAYWRLIYDTNKDIIGNHPNDIKVGLEISIPPLPPELKKK